MAACRLSFWRAEEGEEIKRVKAVATSSSSVAGVAIRDMDIIMDIILVDSGHIQCSMVVITGGESFSIGFTEYFIHTSAVSSSLHN